MLTKYESCLRFPWKPIIRTRLGQNLIRTFFHKKILINRFTFEGDIDKLT